jgi:hypothetical protein
MDNSTRNALIVVLIVVPVFVAIVLWGLLKHDTPPSGTPKDKANSVTVPSVFHGIGNLFGSLRPSLELPQTTFRVPGNDGRVSIAVPPARKPSEKFRNGKFRLLANGAKPDATLDYQDTAAAMDKTYANLASQLVGFPAPLDEKKRLSDDPSGLVGSIVAMKSGGTLTIHCKSSVPCTFELIR